MSDSLLTHKALAALLGVSETTVKSYRRKFPGCIPVFSEGKPIQFTKEAAAVAIRIRDLFTSGMSVKEVRSRLSNEFPWISSDTPKKEQVADAKPSPELTTGVSNMAKSMVALTQQQTMLLKRMQTIEAQLADLGLKGIDMAKASTSEVSGDIGNTERIEQRLEQLDSVTQNLMQTMSSLAEDLGRFLGNRDKAAAEWQSKGGIRSLDSELHAAAMAELGIASEEPSVVEQKAQVIPLRPAISQPSAPQQPASHGNDFINSPQQVDPPRHFFSLPMVVRTEQGQYVSADRRVRGRFCLNDLKAILVYGTSPANRYTLGWEPHGQGWWLILTQPQQIPSRTLRLLLMEVPGRSGESVVEVLHLQENDETLHPTTLARILEEMNG